MAKKKRHNNVSQMVRELSENKAFADDFEEQLERRQVVKGLMASRASLGLSQKDIADFLGCTQSRVSKLENGNDADLHLNDLAGYAAALGYDVTIAFTPKNWTAADEVKYHAFCIKKLLSLMTDLVAGDQSIGQGVLSFFQEAKHSLGKIVQSSVRTLVAMLRASDRQLPLFPEEHSHPIRMEKREITPDESCESSDSHHKRDCEPALPT